MTLEHACEGNDLVKEEKPTEAYSKGDLLRNNLTNNKREKY
jgi:hypothetical protein